MSWGLFLCSDFARLVFTSDNCSFSDLICCHLISSLIILTFLAFYCSSCSQILNWSCILNLELFKFIIFKFVMTSKPLFWLGANYSWSLLLVPGLFFNCPQTKYWGKKDSWVCNQVKAIFICNQSVLLCVLVLPSQIWSWKAWLLIKTFLPGCKPKSPPPPPNHYA